MENILENIENKIVDVVRQGHVKITPFSQCARDLSVLISAKEKILPALSKAVELNATLQSFVCDYAKALSNSAQEIELEKAIQIVGIQRLVGYALAIALIEDLDDDSFLYDLKIKSWKNAFLLGEFTSGLAEKRTLDIHQAFLSGLIYEIGRFLAISCIEHIAKEENLDANSHPIELWEAIIEKKRVELGCIVIAKWDLPSDFMQILNEPETSTLPLIASLHTSRQLVDLLNQGDLGFVSLNAIESLEADERLFMMKDPNRYTHLASVIDAMDKTSSFISEESGALVENNAPLATNGPLQPIRTGIRQLERLPIRFAGHNEDFFAVAIDNTQLFVEGPIELAENTMVNATLIVSEKEISFMTKVISSKEDIASLEQCYSTILETTNLDGDAAKKLQVLHQGKALDSLSKMLSKSLGVEKNDNRESDAFAALSPQHASTKKILDRENELSSITNKRKAIRQANELLEGINQLLIDVDPSEHELRDKLDFARQRIEKTIDVLKRGPIKATPSKEEKVAPVGKLYPTKDRKKTRPWGRIVFMSLILVGLGGWRVYTLIDPPKRGRIITQERVKGENTVRVRSDVVLTESSLMANAPELTEIALMNTGKGLMVEAAAIDNQNNPIQFIYRWYRNGQPLAVDKDLIPKVQLQKGKYSVVVVASDGINKSKELKATMEVN